jgi:hypothetical protein
MANQIILLVGRRNSGKTNTAKNIINAYLKAHGDSNKILILDTLDHPDYQHIRKIEPSYIRAWKSKSGVYRCFSSAPDPEASNDWLIREACSKNSKGIPYFNNGLLILEDSIKFFKKGIIPDFFLNYIIDSKQMNVDIILMFHAFGLIPPDLWRFANQIVIHKTNETWQFVKGRAPAAGQIEKEFSEVQASENRYYKLAVKLD